MISNVFQINQHYNTYLPLVPTFFGHVSEFTHGLVKKTERSEDLLEIPSIYYEDLPMENFLNV